MRLLLDTQAAIVLADQTLGGSSALSRKVRLLVEDPANERLLSSISVTEIAIKSRLGKLTLDRRKVSLLAHDLRLTIIPYTPAHANALLDLPLHHNDPVDRMLIATALVEGIPLVSGDRQLKSYKGLSVIW